MTIVELFSGEMSENLLSALCLRPEKVIFLGTQSQMTDGRIAALRAFFKGRPGAPALRFLRVKERDYAGAGNAIRDTLREEPEVCFEMTGGSDLTLAALGAAAAEKKLTLFELEVRQQRLRLLQGASPALKPGLIRPLRGITVSESIRLRGGSLAESSYTLAGALPPDLERDVADLWQVYQASPEIWTRQCSLLANLTAKSGGRLTVSGTMPEKCEHSHIQALEKLDLISGYREEGNTVTLTFRNAHVKRTLTRAGDLLELWVFLAARESGFTDAVMGAKIDWNGTDRGGTSNEIDGLLMYGAVPVYVSCKIGAVPKEALYEVDTVASRFGGEYAVKALACSRLGGPEATRETLRQRARDMGVLLIEEVDRLPRKELARRLRSAAQEGVSLRLTQR